MSASKLFMLATSSVMSVWRFDTVASSVSSSSSFKASAFVFSFESRTHRASRRWIALKICSGVDVALMLMFGNRRHTSDDDDDDPPSNNSLHAEPIYS